MLAEASELYVGKPLDLIKEGIDARGGFSVKAPVFPVFVDLDERVRLRIFGVIAFEKIMQYKRVALIIHQRLDIQVGERRCLISEVKSLAIFGDGSEERQIVCALVRLLVVQIIIFERGISPTTQMQVQIGTHTRAAAFTIVQMNSAVQHVVQIPIIGVQ